MYIIVKATTRVILGFRERNCHHVLNIVKATTLIVILDVVPKQVLDCQAQLEKLESWQLRSKQLSLIRPSWSSYSLSHLLLSLNRPLNPWTSRYCELSWNRKSIRMTAVNITDVDAVLAIYNSLVELHLNWYVSSCLLYLRYRLIEFSPGCYWNTTIMYVADIFDLCYHG